MTARPTSVEVDSPWLLPLEVAAYSRTDVTTVYDALKSGELVGYRRGERGRWRIHRTDVDAWNRGEIGAAS